MDKTSVQLSWNPPRDEGARSDTSYKVDIELSSCPSCATAVTFNPSQQTSQTSMTISNLTPGVIYKLRVYASNGVSSLGNYTKIVSRKLIEKFISRKRYFQFYIICTLYFQLVSIIEKMLTIMLK